MSYNFFAYISRMRYIDRWALMRNTERENIQEHSHRVAVLAHALAVITNEKFGGHVDEGKAAVAGLYHDASEILTGDMPTPVKYYNPMLRDTYHEVEHEANDKLLNMLPEELRPIYRPVLMEEDEDVHQIVKAADKLDAYLKCVEEVKSGNAEFREAKVQTWAALKKFDLPALDYFIENFVPGFSLSLDELNREN